MRRLSVGLMTVATALVTAATLAASGRAASGQAARSTTIEARTAVVARPVSCPQSTAPPGCHVTVQLRTTAGDAYRRGVLVGQATTMVAAGGQHRMTVALTSLGRRLLRARAPLPLSATTRMTVPRAAPPTVSTTSTSPPATAPASTSAGQSPATPAPSTSAGQLPAAPAPSTTPATPVPSTPASSTPPTTTTPSGYTIVTGPNGVSVAVPAGQPLPGCGLGPPALPAGGPGQTGIVGGIYLAGGPAQLLPPACTGTPTPEPASAGTVGVYDDTGSLVATLSVGAGETFTIPLQPGTYTIQSFQSGQTPLASSNGEPYNFCRGDGSFTVTDGNQTVAPVYCNVP